MEGVRRLLGLPRYWWERSGSRTLRIPRTYTPSDEALGRISAWTGSVRNPVLSVCIPTTDRLDLLIPCLDSLATTCNGQPVEVVIGSTGGTDLTLELLARLGVRTICSAPPFNFSRACNEMEKTAAGRRLLFLNSDTQALSVDWVDRLLNTPEDTIASATLVYPATSRVQHAGVEPAPVGMVRRFLEPAGDQGRNLSLKNVALGKRLEDLNEPQTSVMAVTGAFLYTGRDRFESLGGFDQAFQSDLQDFDYCLRGRRAGMQVVCRHDIVFSHKHAATRGRYGFPDADWKLFLARHGDELERWARERRA